MMQADLKQVPRGLRELLTNRMVPVGPLWIVGQPDDWNEKTLKQIMPLLFKNVKEEDRKKLSSVRSFAAWVQTDDPIVVRATFDCADDRKAKDLQNYFNIPDAGVSREWSAVRGDGWLTVQIRTDWERVRDALER
jgi:hypothetical protein